MKKLFFTAALGCLLFAESKAHVDLYGIYVRLSNQSFYCAMISTKLCARVSAPDNPDADHPWKSQFLIFNPDGEVVDRFEAASYTVQQDGGGVKVDYILP